MKPRIVLFWFRRDLRLEDNVGLAHALANGLPVKPIFIFDTTILHALDNKYDRRVDYIHQALNFVNVQLIQHQSCIQTFYANPLDAFKEICGQYDIQAVYCNRDYEPSAIKRDAEVKTFLAKNGIAFYDFKDHVIFEKDEVLKNDQTPYTIYTPYAKKWRNVLQKVHFRTGKMQYQNFYKDRESSIHSLETLGFKKTDILFEKPKLDRTIITDYHKYRDFPELQRTTQLGIALRFGTISIRECVAFAVRHNDIWLSELIWREFFIQILFHFPKVVHQSFKPQYDNILWINNETEFQKWCSGETGYPIVDAGMKQLNQTGYMHNRVRMIVASFLCKHLLIDWRWGETYFAEKLNDYDLSANNGNWQWAAGCGCDAAPYFRVFNPTLQTLKFDKDFNYIRRWNPTFDQTITAPPIIAHEYARARAIETYKKGLQ